MKTYTFDLDNTLCFTEGNDYNNSQPIKHRIAFVNKLYDLGNIIKIYTARGMTTFRENIGSVYDNYFLFTKSQLDKWGVQYHKLMMGKPLSDIFIDDKAFNSKIWFCESNKVKGIVAGAFDVYHPGYAEMFEKCGMICDHIIVALHNDPSTENGKIKPILTLDERIKILKTIRYVDEIIPYNTENELYEILTRDDIKIRFLGDDYKNKEFTGKCIKKDIYYINRQHGWSSTKFKNLIYEQISNSNGG